MVAWGYYVPYFGDPGIEALDSKSEIPGCEGAKIWCLRRHSIQERIKLRAVVMAKEFAEKLTAVALKTFDLPNLDWRGRVYIGQTQILRQSR